MQTFLPYPDFVKSALVLDYRRLGKQRVEARQILDIIVNDKKALGVIIRQLICGEDANRRFLITGIV